MAMTGTQMTTEVRANLNRTTGGVSDARILVWLNWAQESISDTHTFEEMKKVYTGTTVASQKRYGFPTRMKDIVSLRLRSGAQSRKLTYIHFRDLDATIPEPTQLANGIPDWYVDYGVNFELYRIPDLSTYTLELRCSVYPTDLVAAATSDLLRKDRLICAVATVFGFWAIREYEEATYWAKENASPLMAQTVNSDHSAEDWDPIARPFVPSGEHALVGEWWKNPFTGFGI